MPLVNVLPLSFSFTLHCPDCDAGTGSRKQFPLPAGTLLSSGSRGCWRDTPGGTRLFFWVPGALLLLAPSVLGQLIGRQVHLLPGSLTAPPPRGSIPAGSADTPTSFPESPTDTSKTNAAKALPRWCPASCPEALTSFPARSVTPPGQVSVELQGYPRRWLVSCWPDVACGRPQQTSPCSELCGLNLRPIWRRDVPKFTFCNL